MMVGAWAQVPAAAVRMDVDSAVERTSGSHGRQAAEI